jgi:hypothetical protein
MPFKETKSTTTTSSARETIKGPTKGQSRTKVASISTTRRKLTRGETAGGILTTLGQLEMIGITIVVLSIGSTIYNFDVEDLTAMTPNYNVRNSFIPIENPLETINYQPYGENLFTNFFDEEKGFIYALDGLATTTDNIIKFIQDPLGTIQRLQALSDDYQEQILNPAVDSFIDEFGAPRFAALEIFTSTQLGGRQTPGYIYDLMTEAERIFVRDNFADLQPVEILLFIEYRPDYFYWFGYTHPITGEPGWGYFKWPSILALINGLGV